MVPVSALPHDEQGAGEAVLLLHAGVADRRMWADDLGWLADAGYRAIAVDLPGFGEARVPGAAPWEDVLQTLRALGLDQAAIVGNSFGGAVALRVAAIAPSAVSRLMLVSPPPLDDEPSVRLAAAWEAEESALEEGDIDGAVEAVLEAWVQPDAPAALRERIADMQRNALEIQTQADEIDDAPDPLEQHPEALDRLAMPVLTTAGEHDMPDFKRAAEEIAGRVRDGRFVMLEGAGHLASLETPDAFRDLALTFLRGDGHGA
jgi:pimeloyl-ACP methyl ester carboxylesterase